MSSGVRFTPAVPKAGTIYLAVSWRDFEDRNNLDTSIILTTKPPDDSSKPDGGLEYYHEWKAVSVTESDGFVHWEVHTESGWLGFKSKLSVLLELARVEHADPYALFHTALCSMLVGHDPDDAGVRSFTERVISGVLALAEDPEKQVTIPETAELTLREQAGEVVSFAILLARDLRVRNTDEVEVVPDWVRTLLVFKLGDENS